MSLWHPETLVVGIDTDTVATLTGESFTVHTAVPDSAPEATAGEADDPVANSLLELLAAVQAGKMKRTPRRIRVLAGVDLCRHWTLASPDGVASLSELRAIAAARCRQLFGGRDGDWAILADWSLVRPFVCAAIPSRTVDAVQAVAVASRVRVQIESALLAHIARLEPWLPVEGWTGWQSPKHLILVLRRRGRIAWLQTQLHGHDTGNDTMTQEAARQIIRHALRNGEPRPQALTWLGAVDPGHRSEGETEAATDFPLMVSAVANLPDWHRNPRGYTEAQWAAALASSN